uniref:Uncharacterized protein n=1 Tax=Oryza rufipogon TaxID=4529 RepID=A0A0E0PRS8_ORYRU
MKKDFAIWAGYEEQPTTAQSSKFGPVHSEQRAHGVSSHQPAPAQRGRRPWTGGETAGSAWPVCVPQAGGGVRRDVSGRARRRSSAAARVGRSRAVSQRGRKVGRQRRSTSVAGNDAACISNPLVFLRMCEPSGSDDAMVHASEMVDGDEMIHGNEMVVHDSVMIDGNEMVQENVMVHGSVVAPAKEGRVRHIRFIK